MSKYVLIFFIFNSLNFICQFNSDSIFSKQMDDYSIFFKKLKKNFVDEIDVNHVLINAKKQTIQSLDPHSRYYTNKESQRRNKAWKGISYAGIGAFLIKTNKGVIISSIREGYGADLSGLKPGDLIQEVQDENCLEYSLPEVVKLLKGKENSFVKILVKREDLDHTFKVKRQNIINQSINFADTIANDIGVIKIDQFLRGSGDLFRKNIKELIDKGTKKLVIDLRGNIGGLVNETVTALSAFLEKGTKVYELRSNDAKSNYVDSTTLDPISTEIKLAILISNKTISSGEIFSGVLQDLDRAIIIGQPTHGKGLVQGTRFFKDGSSIYITAARYHLPSGRCIQKVNYSDNYNKNLMKQLVKDSIYYSKNKRPFYSSLGIIPDVKYEHKKDQSTLISNIINSNIVFDFSVIMNRRYGSTYNDQWDSILKEWKKYLLDNCNKVKFDEDLYLKSLNRNDMSSKWQKKLFKMQKIWEKEKYNLLENSVQLTSHLLKQKLILFNDYERGVYRFKLKKDLIFEKASTLLIGNDYYLILSEK